MEEITLAVPKAVFALSMLKINTNLYNETYTILDPDLMRLSSKGETLLKSHVIHFLFDIT